MRREALLDFEFATRAAQSSRPRAAHMTVNVLLAPLNCVSFCRMSLCAYITTNNKNVIFVLVLLHPCTPASRPVAGAYVEVL